MAWWDSPLQGAKSFFGSFRAPTSVGAALKDVALGAATIPAMSAGSWAAGPWAVAQGIHRGVEGTPAGAPPVGASAGDPNNIQGYLNLYTGPSGQPVDTSQAMNYLKNFDPNLFKKGEDPNKIRQAIQQYAQAAQWSPQGTATSTTGTSADVLDPIGVQQFYASSIAPFMQQLGQNESWVTQQYQNMANQNIPGLPASYNAALQQNARSMAAAGQHAYDTSTQAAAQQPYVNAITQQLGAILKEKQTQVAQQAKLSGAAGSQAAYPVNIG